MLVGASERRLPESLAGTGYHSFFPWLLSKAGTGSHVATGEV